MRKRFIASIVAISCLVVPMGAHAQEIAPPSASGATLAKIVVNTKARKAPGGRVIMNLKTESPVIQGTAQYLVVSSKTVNGTRWLQVRLPIRPNETTGWIVADHALTYKTLYRVLVDTGSRKVTVFKGRRAVKNFRAVVGTSSTPTPTGSFAISESIEGSSSNFTGTQVVLLTAFSNVLRSFGGGPGRVAIHGRGGASLNDPLGAARSHGCVRIDNTMANWIANNLEPGTPVNIQR